MAACAVSGWPAAGHRLPGIGAASGPMGNQEQSGSSTELCSHLGTGGDGCAGEGGTSHQGPTSSCAQLIKHSLKGFFFEEEQILIFSLWCMANQQ